jgi:uncharacterized protein (TIGR02147 family)
MIISGKRALTSDVADKLSRALKLRGRQRKYFFELARLSQARAPEQQLDAKEELLRLRTLGESRALPLAQYRFLAQWYYVVLYVLAGLPDFNSDPQVLATHLRNRVTPSEVAVALQTMVALGLLVRDGERYLPAHGTALNTTEDIQSLAIQRFHRQMLQLAQLALNLPVADREITSLTVAMPKSKLPEVKARIRQFRESLDLLLDGSGAGEGDEVYQLNVQFFPLTVKEKR